MLASELITTLFSLLADSLVSIGQAIFQMLSSAIIEILLNAILGNPA